MGLFGEACAAKYGFTREAMDAFAIASAERARRANEDGSFEWECTPVALKDGGTVARDERPFKIDVAKIPKLKPAFKADGTITAASSSSNCDGAAALVLMRESTAAQMRLRPLARIAGQVVHAQEPRWFTTAPVGAIEKLLHRTGWRTPDVDLWEVNEAFAAVAMAVLHEFELDHARLNVHGGACALGHPIGASGARILVTLLGALRRRGAKRGIATLCIGGGEATAVAVEML
jgi:acetyl-CoA C-acetyltransferase